MSYINDKTMKNSKICLNYLKKIVNKGDNVIGKAVRNQFGENNTYDNWDRVVKAICLASPYRKDFEKVYGMNPYDYYMKDIKKTYK